MATITIVGPVEVEHWKANENIEAGTCHRALVDVDLGDGPVRLKLYDDAEWGELVYHPTMPGPYGRTAIYWPEKGAWQQGEQTFLPLTAMEAAAVAYVRDNWPHLPPSGTTAPADEAFRRREYNQLTGNTLDMGEG